MTLTRNLPDAGAASPTADQSSLSSSPGATGLTGAAPDSSGATALGQPTADPPLSPADKVVKAVRDDFIKKGLAKLGPNLSDRDVFNNTQDLGFKFDYGLTHRPSVPQAPEDPWQPG